MDSTNLVSVSIPMPTSAASEAAQAALDAAKRRQVVTYDDYQQAALELSAVKSKAKEIDDARKVLKRPIDEAAKRIQEFFRAPLEFLASAEAVLKTKLVSYQHEQDRIAREAQQKLDEEARKERERLEEQARKAEAAGRIEKAAKLERQAASVVAPVIQRDVPKTTGVQTREVWKFEVVDESAVPDEYKMIDEARIRKVVGALKGDTRIPGVRVWMEKSVVAGRT